MPTIEVPPLEVRGLTKRFGAQLAVDDLSFTVAPGRVTGFLGPNGAGKTTTLRMLVGLSTPTAGEALVCGRPYRELPSPATVVGTLIDARSFHPARRVRHELSIHAAAVGVDDARIAEVLREVGMDGAADKRIGQLSLGMRQRVGLAAALLGGPQVLLLDEPANGLDPAGMHWLRVLLRGHADRGTTVLVSSHVLSELALFADDVVVVNHGHLIAQATLHELVSTREERVIVRTPHPADLRRVLEGRGATVAEGEAGLSVTGMVSDAVGDIAAAAGVALHELRTEVQSLEDVFLDLTNDEEAIR